MKSRVQSFEPVTQTEPITREEMVRLLNEDLAREYQAVIAYVVYSQVLKGAAYTDIATELEKHAAEELSHALTISRTSELRYRTTATVSGRPRPWENLL